MTSELDPQAQDLLDVMRAARLAPLQTLSVDAARERMRRSHVASGQRVALDRVDDVSVPVPGGTRTLRLYRPCAGDLPVALFLHGGGWVLNDLDTHDDLCRRLAARSGWLFAALDYRRAPEHKYPAAIDDAYYAYRWLGDNAVKLGCLSDYRALVGESSGGTIAATLSLLLRDSGAPMPVGQALAYPMTDRIDSWPSYAQRGSGYALDHDQLEWFMHHYLPESHDAHDPHLFPMAATGVSGLPPTLIMTAEFDPLRDEGIAYAKKLADAGGPVEHRHAHNQMHGFLMQGRAVASANELIDYLADAVAAFGKASTTTEPAENAS